MKVHALAAVVGLALSPSALARVQDGDVELLLRRRDRPLPIAVGVPQTFGFAAPRVLFTHAGEDNAAALVAHPDASGDGVPDVAVGWEIFQSGNDLELVDGGSFDAAGLVWGVVSQDGLSGGYYSDADQLALYPDINGDGIAELLSGTSGGGRAATLYDGALGVELQSFDTYLGPASGWVYQVLPVPDVNGSGVDDIALVTGSDANAVYLVEGNTAGEHHTELWSFTALDALFAVDLLGDVDGDGATDLVVAAGDNADRIHGLSGADGSELWVRPVAGTPWELAAYPDQDGDGVAEVAVAVWSSSQTVQLLDGATGDVRWTSGVPGTYGMDVVPLEDFDGDGWPELAVASWADRLYVLSGIDGSLAWQGPLTGGDVWAVTRVDDVTGDGVSELAYGSFDGFAYLADGASGATLWTHFADGRKVLAIRSAPDMDGDGSPEVLVGAQQLGSGSATLLWVVDADSTLAGPELRAPTSVAIGTPADLQLQDAPPGDVVLWYVGTAPALFPNVGYGWLALTPPFFLSPFTSLVPVGGRVSLSLAVPADASLVGVDAYLQAFVLEPVAPFFGTTSNRVAFELTP